VARQKSAACRPSSRLAITQSITPFGSDHEVARPVAPRNAERNRLSKKPPVNIPRMYTPMTNTEAGNVTVEDQSDKVTESKFWILNESTIAVSNTINTM
jgi:hypothetical protein